MLHSISRNDVHRIQSAQVITSLTDATKELVENAIDAGAKKISIKFVNYGLDVLEVTDNGPGIEERDFEALVAKHATSKLSSFSDLESLETLGFRGEALSSLCALSTLAVTTCTESTYPRGITLEYSEDGALRNKTTTSAQKGTTMRVEGLFATLPVRRKEFEKNAKKDFVKTTKLLQAYAAVHPELHMDAVNVNGNSRSQLLGKNGTTGKNNLKNNLIDLFGIQLGKILVELSTEVSFKSVHHRREAQSVVKMAGYLSSPQKEYGGQTDRQLIYINSRPCHLPKVARCINDTYSLVGANRTPFVILNLTMPTDSYDVNITPDKMTIYLHDEQVILDHLKATIEALFSNDRREFPPNTIKREDSSSFAPQISTRLSAKYTLNSPRSISDNARDRPLVAADPQDQIEAMDVSESQDVDGDGEKSPELENTSDVIEVNDQESSDEPRTSSDYQAQILSTIRSRLTQRSPAGDLTRFNCHAKSNTSSRPISSSTPILKRLRSTESLLTRKRQTKLGFAKSTTLEDETAKEDQDSDMEDEEVAQSEDEPHIHDLYEQSNVPHKNTEPSDSNDPEDNLNSIEPPVKPVQRFIPRLNHIDHSPPSHHVHSQTVTLDTSTAFVSPQRPARPPKSSTSSHPDLTHASIEDSSEVAEEALSLNVSKSDFFGMSVIGQFNLGFIIVSRHDELFIIDQHASDEKSNYEKLLRETEFRSQPLARPMELILSAIERLSIDDHLETLKRNGFDIIVDRARQGSDEIENGSEGQEEEEAVRYLLTTLPVSKNLTFDVSDLQELLDLLVTGTPSTSVRCTKAKRMFASRACRSSIMIGTALTRERMQAVVWRLGEMEAPWNCPHGRPTMRHLTSIASLDKWTADCKSPRSDWM